MNLEELFHEGIFGKRDVDRMDQIHSDWDEKLPKTIVIKLEERERMIAFLKFHQIGKGERTQILNMIASMCDS